MRQELKLSVKLDLPCGCTEEHSFGEGEIVYFIEHEDKFLDRAIFGFWLKEKMQKHRCPASTEDIERYLLEIVNKFYGSRTDYNEDIIRFIADKLAESEGKKIV